MLPSMFRRQGASAPGHFCALLAALCLVSLLTGCSSASNSPTAGIATSVTTTPSVKPKFAYTGNQGASISGYSVDPATGTLTSLSGFPLAVGLNPEYVTHDPQNRFLIVSDIAANLLHVYAIDASSGALKEVSPSPYNMMIESEKVVVDPSGSHVYLYRTGSSDSYPGVSGNQIVAFNLSATGVLTPITGSPFLVGASGATFDSAFGMVIGTTGKFLYLKGTTHLYTFAIDSATGALSLLQTLATEQFGDLAVDPGGSFLYAAGQTALASYAVDPSTGLLTLAKSSVAVSGSGAYTLAISPNGKYAYTVEGNTLVSYALSNGAFTHVGATWSGVYGQNIGIDPTGSFLYVPQACSNCPGAPYNVVHEFGISSTGTLTPLSSPTVAAGITPWDIAIISQ